MGTSAACVRRSYHGGYECRWRDNDSTKGELWAELIQQREDLARSVQGVPGDIIYLLYVGIVIVSPVALVAQSPQMRVNGSAMQV